MRHIIITIIAIVFAVFTAGAQTTKPAAKPNVTVTADGNYKAVERSAAATATKTDKTYTDSKGEVYPVYRSKNGKHFVVKTSKKTGNKYNYYLNLPGE